MKMTYQKHRFHGKENNQWFIYCPESRISFNTILWETGVCEKQTCPHCKQNVNELVYIVPDVKHNAHEYLKEQARNHKLAKWC